MLQLLVNLGSKVVIQDLNRHSRNVIVLAGGGDHAVVIGFGSKHYIVVPRCF
jgi:hypothetical protein